jgi:enamine deaminase RidA (YjgF/YER057c/UK114 family)
MKKINVKYINLILLVISSSIALSATATKTWGGFEQPTITEESTDSPYRKAGELIFISTQVPISPLTHELVSSDISKQVDQVLENLRQQVIASGGSMKDVMKINVYMDDIDLVFPIVKEYIPHYFEKPYPARSPFGGLTFRKSTGFRIAMDAVVYAPNLQPRSS